MGALSGSITYCKFHVQGDLPDNVKSAFVRRIGNRVFEPLAPDDEADRRWGWCNIQDPFDLELDSEKVFFNSYLNLGLRIDRWALPKPLFRANMKQAIAAALQKKDRERLSRKEKDELKVTVTRRMRRQTLPSMKVMDLSWNLDTGVLRFWNRSSKMVELMTDFFEKTFEKKLLPHSPYSIALRAKISDREMKEFESLEPAVFHAEVR